MNIKIRPTMNTHETYVSLEVAKLLKDAGFDWECCYCYDAETKDFLNDNEGEFNFNEGDDNDFYSAPTLTIAQRWLREVKDMFISTLYTVEGWKAVATYPKPLPEKIYAEFVFCRDSYEQALEAGINKCLTILLEEKK